jgi:DNA repair ATPase RecN
MSKTSSEAKEIEGMVSRRIRDSIDPVIKRIKEMKKPEERLDSLCYIITRTAVEIDACYEMQGRQHERIRGLEERVDLLEQGQPKVRVIARPANQPAVTDVEL